jgi:excisionase family DNA binding protein
MFMQILTVREAAKALGVARVTMFRMLDRGAFPNAYKTGDSANSHWRIPEEDIVKFKHTKKPTHESIQSP